jgi:hypothetical protein
MPEVFETIVVSGYVVTFNYHDNPPPIEICSAEHPYHDGYVRMTITVTKDNISVSERVETMFFVAPIEFESHEVIKHEQGITFPLVYGECISSLMFSGSSLDLTGEVRDCDVITVMVNDAGPADYSGAEIFMVHDKENVFTEFAIHE